MFAALAVGPQPDLIGSTALDQPCSSYHLRNPGRDFLSDLSLNENAIAFALHRWFAQVVADDPHPEDRALYGASRFPAQLVSLIGPEERRMAVIRDPKTFDPRSGRHCPAG